MRRLGAVLSFVVLAGCAVPTTPAPATPPQPSALQAATEAPEDPSAIDAAEGRPTGDLDNFHKVADGIYRGARPTARGVAKLKAMGVKTILSLENVNDVIRQERETAKIHGLGFHSIQMNVFTPPSLLKVETALDVITSPSHQPIYFHCQQGRDRTGTIAYCYRVRYQGWSHDKAFAEMEKYGFHSYLLGLRGFVAWYGHRYSRQDGVTNGLRPAAG